jgi:hypothetical protein
MKLQLKRKALEETYTIGDLLIDGVFFCNVLEDKVRDYNKDGKLDEPKIPGETAIPYGTYKVIITFSQRFQRDLPLLLNVPDFDGIRIHPGNTAVDTHGCLLVGNNTIKGTVTESKVTFDKLFTLMTNSGQSEFILEII